MPLRVIIPLFAAAMLCTGCGPGEGVQANSMAISAPAATDAQPLVLADSVVHHLTSSATGRRYPLWVSVPASYATGEKSYPVLFVTDAAYSFPLVLSIRGRLTQRGRNLDEFILVGLPSEEGLSSRESRSRDYTPSNPLLKPNYDKSEYTAPAYGEASAYRDYLEKDAIPFVASRYRTDGKRRVYAGHSFGGLFGAYVLLTKPELFDTYILGSPSLWFDESRVFEMEEEFASRTKDLSARVAFYIGAFETPGPSPRNFRETDMVGDMLKFTAQLASRKYPGLEMTSETLSGEDHLTVYPAMITRGLLWALPGTGPYVPG